MIPQGLQPCVLYRRVQSHGEDAEEIAACQAALPIYFQRTEIPTNSLVVGRYSTLPFYNELARDLANRGCMLINSPREHNFIVDLDQWYEVLGPALTPETWSRFEDLPDDTTTAYVLKGSQNSRKDRFSTHMFAKGKANAITVRSLLQDDLTIQSQTIYARRWVSFKRLGMNTMTGCPVSHEFRFFVLDGQILCSGFYWTDADLDPVPVVPLSATQFVSGVAARLKDHTRFVVIDVAEAVDGKWWVVELNEGQHSGLSACDPRVLYTRLGEVLRG